MNKVFAWILILTLATLACGISTQAQSQLPSPSDAPSPSNPRVFVREFDTYTVTGFLNIRTGAGESFPSLGVLHYGDVVTCSEWVGDWCRHSQGWSHGGWLK